MATVAEADLSQVARPMRAPNVSGIGLPRATVRRAVMRSDMAVERAAPVATVKVLVPAFHVPNSMSLLGSRTTGEPSQVLAPPYWTARFCVVVMEPRPVAPARAAAIAARDNSVLASCTRP